MSGLNDAAEGRELLSDHLILDQCLAEGLAGDCVLVGVLCTDAGEAEGGASKPQPFVVEVRHEDLEAFVFFS